ncbi:gp24 [Streptococcus pneumoniae]|nr:gp24 [Streptococcus pneumoniae]
MEELKRKVNTVYNWTVEDGKPQPPKQDLPQVVKTGRTIFGKWQKMV